MKSMNTLQRVTVVNVPVSSLSIPSAESATALLGHFLSGRSPLTLKAYRQDIVDFQTFCQEPTPSAAIAALFSRASGDANATLLAYRASLIARTLSPATINRRLAALRSLVRLGRSLGFVTWSLDIQNVPARSYRDTQGPGIPAFRRLLTSLDARPGPKSTRDRAILRLLFDLGLRRGEVSSLEISDLDIERGLLAVKSKGHRDKDLLALPSPTRAALQAWLTVRGSHPGPLFRNFDRAKKSPERLTGTGIYNLLERLGRKLKLHIRPHGLRHTAITEAIKSARAAGIGLEEVQDFSRHKDIKTLLIYRDRERNVQGRLADLVAGQAAPTA